MTGMKTEERLWKLTKRREVVEQALNDHHDCYRHGCTASAFRAMLAAGMGCDQGTRLAGAFVDVLDALRQEINQLPG